jgi:hypothetical protein
VNALVILVAVLALVAVLLVVALVDLEADLLLALVLVLDLQVLVPEADPLLDDDDLHLHLLDLDLALDPLNVLLLLKDLLLVALLPIVKVSTHLNLNLKKGKKNHVILIMGCSYLLICLFVFVLFFPQVEIRQVFFW